MTNRRRDTLIRFLRYETTENDFGEPVEADTPVGIGREWANVIYGRGDERRQAAMESASMAATFRVLSNSETRAVRATDIIDLDGEWDIQGIAPRGRSEIEFTAVRRVK